MMRDAGLMIKNESGCKKRWMDGLGIYYTSLSQAQYAGNSSGNMQVLL